MMTGLLEAFEQALNGCGRIVLEDGRESLTGAQLWSLAEEARRSLLEMGVEKGDRVLFAAPNSARWVAAFLGALRLGAVVCPVHPENGQARLNHYAEDSRAAAAVTDRAGMGKLEAARPGRAYFCLDTFKGIRGRMAREGRNRGAFTGLAAILYTSGSTSAPLGVMAGSGQIVFAANAIRSVLGLRAGDAVLCGLPFSFDYGLYQIMLALWSGARLVVRAGFPNPLAIPRDLKENRITVFPAVPSLAAALLKSGLLERASLPELRLVTFTGDVLPATHAKRLGELLIGASIVKMYGLTECKRVSIMPPGLAKGREDSVGLPLPGTRVWLEAKRGVPAPPGRIGELVVSGPHVTNGYWNNPKATGERFSRGPDGEAILRTGDYFRLDGEGFLYFVGRRGRMLKSLGSAVSPAQIEDLLCSIGGVSEAAVLGLPDMDRGSVICAALAVERSFALDERQIIERCSQALPSHCVPRRLRLVRGMLPKNENGKLRRKLIRCLFE